MRIGIVVRCERSVPYGTCAAVLHTGASTVADAYAVAEHAGWDIRGPDFCPAHSYRPTRHPIRLRRKETPNR
ncbi:hypothetical protein [Streptomyces sp. PTD5-9]|uniref:hypothetical protein n=1 Tax=Streptomyces sp. PTD5-9 TaxID=3120150 RepID=UPI003008F50A